MYRKRYDNGVLQHIALTLKLSWPLLLLGIFLTILTFTLMPILALIPAVFLVFTVYFFRHPMRRVPDEIGAVIAPADGKIMSIKTVTEDSFIKGPCKRITIFLSLHNVHINRAPVSGVVTYRHYRPGRFLPAFKSHASEINEKNYIGIETNGCRVMLTQITGFVARRIVCWVNEGDYVDGGQSIGAIKFGSCTEVFVPMDTVLMVRSGERVRAGETVLGWLETEENYQLNEGHNHGC